MHAVLLLAALSAQVAPATSSEVSRCSTALVGRIDGTIMADVRCSQPIDGFSAYQEAAYVLMGHGIGKYMRSEPEQIGASFQSEWVFIVVPF